MAAPSVFSYAQAAKGKVTTPSTTSSQNVAQSADMQTNPATDVTDDSIGSTTLSTAQSSVHESQDSSDPKQEADVNHDSDPEPPVTVATAIAQDSESKQEETVSRLDRPWRRSEKGTRSSSITTRSVEEPDARRPRRGKKSRNVDKQTNGQAASNGKPQGEEPTPEPEPPKIELSDAPLPSVNIWVQRRETQQAKGPVSSVTISSIANGVVADTVSDGKKSNQQTVEPLSNNSSTQRPENPSTELRNQRRNGDHARGERSGVRGARLAEREAKEAKSVIPPPVADAGAWPTPETVLHDDKKRTTERTDKEREAEDAQAKPRQKKEWVTYDYVPTVNFETQLPQMRGSKARGGARTMNGSRSASNQQSAEKPVVQPASNPAETKDTKERPREPTTPNGVVVEDALTSSAGKRPSIDGTLMREQKKSSNYANGDKFKEGNASRGGDSHGPHPPRERHEGRGERNRGGYRGRGGHNSANVHAHGSVSSNASGYPSNGPPIVRGHNHYSPPPRQGGHGNHAIYGPPSQRGGRGNRNGVGSSFHRSSMPNGRLANVQTHFPTYDYPLPPMTAIPYQPQQPYWDGMIAVALKSQIEYYFSVENLCKDLYLRKRMDSQGFVPLHFVAGFRRVRELSSDHGLVRAVCEDSADIDFVIGEDEGERLRRRQGWEQFVLPFDERDELARTNGPNHLTYRTRSYNFGQQQQQFNGAHAFPYGINPPAFPMQADMLYQQAPPESMLNGHMSNGMSHGDMLGRGSATQLSAEVPDFSPSGGALPFENGLPKGANGDRAGAPYYPYMNGHGSAPKQPALNGTAYDASAV